MNTAPKLLGLAALLTLPLAVLGAWALGWLGQPPAVPPMAPAKAMPQPRPGALAPATAVTTAPARQQAVDEHLLSMPDGTFVEPLNGVGKPAPIVWGEHPWSKIVRIQHDPGCDWYVHEDGTYTTTLMRWRTDLQREDPVTLCLHPTLPAPIDTGDRGAAGAAKKD